MKSSFQNIYYLYFLDFVIYNLAYNITLSIIIIILYLHGFVE
jgi:hypothetical protein